MTYKETGSSDFSPNEVRRWTTLYEYGRVRIDYDKETGKRRLFIANAEGSTAGMWVTFNEEEYQTFCQSSVLILTQPIELLLSGRKLPFVEQE